MAESTIVPAAVESVAEPAALKFGGPKADKKKKKAKSNRTRLALGIRRISNYSISSAAVGLLEDVSKMFIERATKTAIDVLPSGRITITTAALKAAIEINVSSRLFSKSLIAAGNAGVTKKNSKRAGDDVVKVAGTKAKRAPVDTGVMSMPRIRRIMSAVKGVNIRISHEAVVFLAYVVTNMVGRYMDKTFQLVHSRNASNQTSRLHFDDFVEVAKVDADIASFVPSGAIAGYGIANKMLKSHHAPKKAAKAKAAKAAKKKAKKSNKRGRSRSPSRSRSPDGRFSPSPKRGRSASRSRSPPAKKARKPAKKAAAKKTAAKKGSAKKPASTLRAASKL
jgi:hypothetical protein